MRKITIAGSLEFLGAVNDEWEDLMVHVRLHMGEEVEKMIRETVSDLENEVRELDEYVNSLECELGVDD